MDITDRDLKEMEYNEAIEHLSNAMDTNKALNIFTASFLLSVAHDVDKLKARDDLFEYRVNKKGGA